MYKLITAAIVILSSGCTHYGNMERNETLSSPEQDVYVSHKAWDDGTPRHVVVEEAQGVVDGCTQVRLTNFHYTRTGVLARQRVETRRCGLPTETVDDRYDFANASWVRSVSQDTDEDGSFDVIAVTPGVQVEPAEALASVRLAFARG